MFKNHHSEKRLVFILVLFVVLLAVSGAVVTAQTVLYHGNTQSKIFHAPGCCYYNCKKCSAVFSSRQEAIDAGYRPCKRCG